ncbi:concanavalin A-like lectin/glucanase domain-containing protein [Chytriomyces sp. MP71]|nr:concanavalin A-like lectin/glucanase domain-containing protein [Chytriomyces sp. MP71]
MNSFPAPSSAATASPANLATSTTTAAQEPSPFTSSVQPVSNVSATQVSTSTPQPSSIPGSPVYTLTHDHTPDSILSGDGWTFFTDADPTHGTVQYINKAQAGSSMYYVGNDNGKYLYMGSRQTGGGAPQSLRLTSVDTLNSGLVIFDALHIPSGCGTWPSFWTVGGDWPNNGEIDFMEGVNGVGNNVMTLHTGPGCSMNLDGVQKSCLANQGCGTTTPHPGTFGNSFNMQDGGVYAMEWLPNPNDGGAGHIKVWSFPRNGIPADIISKRPNPSSWPTDIGAHAHFEFGINCPTSAFANHQIVIDLTFCGDWAGAVFVNQCSATGRSCADYVANDPNALKEAYFKIKGIQVYKLRSV